MSEWTVQLEFAEGTSSKFWRARVEGKTLYVNYGKIGSNGQTQVKDFADAAAARGEYEKLVREKRKKGYQDAGSAKPDDEDADVQTDDDVDDDADDDTGDEAPPAKKPAARPAAQSAARPAAQSAAKSASAAAPGHRMVLDAGGRKIEAILYLDGNTMRMDSRETYASAEAAKKAFDRMKKLLGGEGYRDA
jgi:predicted DNA-binding WGR domain protein